MRVEFDFCLSEVSSNGKRSSDSGPQRSSEAPNLVNKKARQLALAYHIQSLIDSGEVNNIAAVADSAGISRARISQILGLALLAPSIQEGILDASLCLGAHDLRRLVGMLDWEVQKQWLTHLKGETR